jgi:3-oxoacyl-[acyl-carrier-protein] synthase II
MKKKIYINGSSCISLQPTFESKFEKIKEYLCTELHCIEPDYTKIIDPKYLRRMSRVIKMGLATSLAALKQSQNPKIDSIITGTGLGCLEDTENFLSKLSDPNNRMMNPTAFIQSTHNTISSQIALLLGNKGYNCTYTHSGMSFESALDDALLAIKNNEVENVLVGAYDELTPTLLTLLKRLQLIRKQPVLNTLIIEYTAKGYIAGEGSAFFVLSNNIISKSSVEISGFNIFYKPEKETLVSFIKDLNEESNNWVVFLGKNGDISNDKTYEWIEPYFKKSMLFNYKHLCGEYPTSSAFGLWLGVETLCGNTNIVNKESKNILLYNNYKNNYHSFIRLHKC